jgi:hypothetical protein
VAELRRKQGTKRIGVAMVARTKGASNPGTVSGMRRPRAVGRHLAGGGGHALTHGKGSGARGRAMAL